MGLRRIQWGGLLLCWGFCILCFKALGDVPQVSVKFLQAPPLFSNLNSATFVFEALVPNPRENCSNCSFNCKLDDAISPDCRQRNVSFVGLQDGNHSFKVCTNAPQGVGCASCNWTVDTVHPTADISASTSFTNAANVTVNISFSEPCTGGGGFTCSSVDTCNLLVYGAGQVIPNTLKTIQPYLQYSVVVALPANAKYGRVILAMDKGFCTDEAGNRFIRPANATFVHFDRRSVFVSLRTHVPERLLQLGGETRTVQATNSNKNLKVYLYFTEPVLNTSTEIMKSIDISQGSLRPINGSSLANRRFGFLIEDIPGVTAITVSLNSSFVISRQGAPVSPIAPATFLYDSKRPVVRLSTTSKMRTRDRSIAVSIKFMKPVFDFNATHMLISGGHIESFKQISRISYVALIQAYDGILSIRVPENVTADVAGNPNLASNVIEVRHSDSLPMMSTVFSIFVTTLFVATCVVAGFLTISTASLQAAGAFPRSSSSLTSNPTRNLFRIACYIQVFALSRWLAVTLPVEYYEFTRGIEWSVPYLSLPWEGDHSQPMVFSSNTSSSSSFLSTKIKNSSEVQTVQLNKGSFDKAGVVYGAPLTAMEYQTYFESQNYIPEAEYIADPESSTGWRSFERSMFWLVVIAGSLVLVHAFLLLVMKSRKRNEKGKTCSALVFPRFEIFLLIVSVPCICLASAAVIKGRTTLGTITGVLLLIFTSSLLVFLLMFLTIGITLGKLLQYKEIHQVDQKFHWYQELVRVTLGPGKRGQWTWRNEANSKKLAKYGPMFEDLRGPPKYMLSMITAGSHMPVGRIIASDDETEDAEAPLIQKLFGILRIYYTLLESLRRFLLGILAGLHLENSSSSKAPTVVLLSITSFQLFFLVLKKPYIKKKVQLVEIISIACEVGMFATCMVLLEREFSMPVERGIGIFMLCLFMLGFLALMCNEWYALCKQIRKLDASQNSFLVGLKTALIGFFLLFAPEKMVKDIDDWLPEDKAGRSSGESNMLNTTPTSRFRSSESRSSASRSSASRSSSTSDKPWIRQLREMAKASFKQGNGNENGNAVNDPSSSNTRWSGFWRGKLSGSSSKNSSNDYKSRPKSLYKDLEAIFASK